jgi:hypothetical protein
MDKIPVTVIYFSKKKTTFLLITCLSFVTIAISFIIDPPTGRIPFIDSPAALKVLLSVCALFFGVISIFLIKKMFDRRPAIIIDGNGIDDNSSMCSAGYVEWNQIDTVWIIEVNRQKMIAIRLIDVESHMRLRSTFAKKTVKLNYKMYEMHFAISANSLDTDIEPLYKIMVEKINRYSV